MLHRPTELSQTDAQFPTPSKVSTKHKSQHGISDIRRPILIDVPPETLTEITTYLEPPELCTLAVVDRYLNNHVKDDNTWRLAFVYHFLGIKPEHELDRKSTLLLRRSERSWRAEFIVHYKLRRRWAKSRNVTTTHMPVHSIISGMHMMSTPPQSLLTSSIQYGIVGRSFPMTGRVLPGFLDASGTRLGLGIGNPNAEFTPNVSICAIGTDGGTAKIIWGTLLGDVLFMNAPRAIEVHRRSATEIRRCSLADQHLGAVNDAQWIHVQNGYAVTGGMDGRVKVWDTKTAVCLWSSIVVTKGLDPDSCVKVMGSMNGTIASVMKSGDVYVWTGFIFSSTFAAPSSMTPAVIPCPVRTNREGYDWKDPHDVTSAHIDPNNTLPTLLVAYQNDPFFYRLHVIGPKKVEVTTFGEALLGSLSIVTPFFATTNEAGPESSVVFAGDNLGCVGIYDWDAEPPVLPEGSIAPLRKFEVFEDGSSVTALHWNSITLITGSARGVVTVWDGMTFRHLRSFSSHVPRQRGRMAMHGDDPMARESVRHILVNPERDIVFMGIGAHVMSWQAGPVRKVAGGVRGRNTTGVVGKKKRSGNNKYLDQVELKSSIRESRDLLKDQSEHVKRSFGREREQLTSLDTLGLSEAEAVEYVLMLSREEAMAEANALLGAGSSTSNNGDDFFDDGVFEVDFDEEDEDESGTRTPSSGTSRRPSIAPRSGPGSGSGSVFSPVKPSPSQTGKVVVTPYNHPASNEPMEAGAEYLAEEGWMSMSASTSPVDGFVQGTRMPVEEHHFPPIASAETRAVVSAEAEDSPVQLGRKEKKKSTKGKAKHVVTPPSTGSPPSPTSMKASPSTVGTKKHTPSLVPQRSISGGSQNAASPATRNSAWGSPLAKKPSQSTPWGNNMSSQIPRNETRGVWNTPVRASPPQWGPPARVAPAAQDPFGDDMDDDLRFALELSLIEARSRGENV